MIIGLPWINNLESLKTTLGHGFAFVARRSASSLARRRANESRAQRVTPPSPPHNSSRREPGPTLNTKARTWRFEVLCYPAGNYDTGQKTRKQRLLDKNEKDGHFTVRPLRNHDYTKFILMGTSVKAGSHKDDQRTLESPDKTENRINYRKWLTSPKVFGIITLDIEYSNKKGKRRTPSDEKSGTGLYFRFCAYHEREFLPRREVSSHIHFPARMTGVADDTAVRDFLVYQ